MQANAAGQVGSDDDAEAYQDNEPEYDDYLEAHVGEARDEEIPDDVLDFSDEEEEPEFGNVREQDWARFQGTQRDSLEAREDAAGRQGCQGGE